MSTVTFPAWFWAIYYLLLLATLGTAIVCLIRGKIVIPSSLAVVFAITVPIVSLLNSIGRAEGLNEFAHLFRQIQHGAIWSVYASIGYLYILVWWAFFIMNSKKKE
ncbi:hypothetical protein NDK47_21600 [Brevibacillus ruminantium]|uniref:Transmembrane protein n=1 Tax=Brevibacillus ruminantium TaxID=2950604 RepID=A0ABY4WC05_9BACL|nr:hypothetical protein [Brevibacillus ruminantium]USG64710.1 hypothetical protein NDK47_21600 [Brevibacillus ruminantium]